MTVWDRVVGQQDLVEALQAVQHDIERVAANRPIMPVRPISCIATRSRVVKAAIE